MVSRPPLIPVEWQAEAKSDDKAPTDRSNDSIRT